jgi:plasmid maintenance system antidote protein VapI
MEAVTTKQLVAKLQIAHDSSNHVWSHVQELLQLAMNKLEQQDEKIERLESSIEELLLNMGDMP